MFHIEFEILNDLRFCVKFGGLTCSLWFWLNGTI